MKKKSKIGGYIAIGIVILNLVTMVTVKKLNECGIIQWGNFNLWAIITYASIIGLSIYLISLSFESKD